jgi:hypothetical protein
LTLPSLRRFCADSAGQSQIMLKPRLIAILAALGLLFGTPAVVLAQDDQPDTGPDNVVKVDNSTDSTMQAKGKLKVGTTWTDDVESSNIAFATAHDCTGCEARAAALQAVIVVGSPSTFSPGNAAVAVNANCHYCGSFAYAYQYVVQTDRRVEFSNAAQEQIAALKREARQDVQADLPYAQIDANLADVAQRFRAVIDREVARSNADVRDRESRVKRDRSREQ